MNFYAVARKYAHPKNPGWAKLSDRSKRIYQDGLNSLEFFWEYPIKKINRPEVIALRDALYSQPGKCRVALSVLHNIMQYALDKGLINVNPVTGIKNLPPSTPIKRWSKEEIEIMVDGCPPKISTAILLALYTGQRRSDLIKMKWMDYDGKFIHLIQKKTGKSLSIPVHPKLKDVLDRMSKDNMYILTDSSGDRWRADSLSQAVKWNSNRLGLDLTIHGLRKSTASTLAELGCSTFQIAAITGHSIKEVMRYTKEVEQKKLAEEAMARWS